jgi:hypothetical protein
MDTMDTKEFAEILNKGPSENSAKQIITNLKWQNWEKQLSLDRQELIPVHQKDLLDSNNYPVDSDFAESVDNTVLIPEEQQLSIDTH